MKHGNVNLLVSRQDLDELYEAVLILETHEDAKSPAWESLKIFFENATYLQSGASAAWDAERDIWEVQQ